MDEGAAPWLAKERFPLSQSPSARRFAAVSAACFSWIVQLPAARRPLLLAGRSVPLPSREAAGVAPKQAFRLHRR